MKASNLLLAGLALAIVALVFLWESGRTSPGPISGSHALVPALEGGEACAACHAGADVPESGCAGCHEEAAREMREGTGFHGRIPDRADRPCGACHVEHRGEDTVLAGDLAFVLAGFEGGVAGYDHPGADFRLEGRHVGLECSRCHALSAAAVVPGGKRRYESMSQTCATCHDDPHAGGHGPDCGSCHGQERPFAEVSEFRHPAAFPLDGAHRRPSCSICHPVDSPHSIRRPAREARSPRACVDCHEAQYLATRSPDHHRVGYPRTCEACHDTDRFEGAVFRHRFPLDRGKHRGIACADCHDDPRDPGAFTCTDCHAHRRGEMDDEHRRTPGYRYDTPSCHRCHPDGRED